MKFHARNPRRKAKTQNSARRAERDTINDAGKPQIVTEDGSGSGRGRVTQKS